MKKIIKQSWLRPITVILFCCFSLLVFAQNKGIDVDVNIKKEDSQWYMQPWVWVLGGAIFILLLAAILRGGQSRKSA